MAEVFLEVAAVHFRAEAAHEELPESFGLQVCWNFEAVSDGFVHFYSSPIDIMILHIEYPIQGLFILA